MRRRRSKTGALPQPTMPKQVKPAVGEGSNHLELRQTRWKPPSSLNLCLAVRRPVAHYNNGYHSGIPVKPGYCGVVNSVKDRMHDARMIKYFWSRTLYVQLKDDEKKFSRHFRRISRTWFTPRSRIPPEAVLRWFACKARKSPWQIRTTLGCTFTKMCRKPTKDVWEFYASEAASSLYLNWFTGLRSLTRLGGRDFASKGTRRLRRIELERLKESSGQPFASYASEHQAYFLNRHDILPLESLEMRSKASLYRRNIGKSSFRRRPVAVGDCGPELNIQEGHSDLYLSPLSEESSSEEESESDSDWYG